MDFEWIEDPDGKEDPSIWMSLPDPAAPESWMRLFGRVQVTVILCPESIVGRVCSSLKTALESDTERRDNTVIVIPPSESESSMSVSKWTGETARRGIEQGVDSIIVIPERRTDIQLIEEGGVTGRLGSYLLTHAAGRIVELSLDDEMESVCVYRIVKGREDQTLLGRITLLG